MARPSLKRLNELLDPYCVTKGGEFRLADVDPRDTGGPRSEFKTEAKALLAQGVRWLADEQERLYAQDRWSVGDRRGNGAPRAALPAPGRRAPPGAGGGAARPAP
jgi:hypothetical protein